MEKTTRLSLEDFNYSINENNEVFDNNGDFTGLTLKGSNVWVELVTNADNESAYWYITDGTTDLSGNIADDYKGCLELIEYNSTN